MPHFETPEDMAQLIRFSYLAEEYKPELLGQISDLLANPDQCLIMFASKSFDEATLPHHQKWYKFNYSLEKLSESRKNELRNPIVEENGKKLDYPPSNNLIATNFDILPEDSSSSIQPKLVK